MAGFAVAFLLDTSALPGVRHRQAELRSSSERLAQTAELYAAARADRGRFRIHHEEPREQAVWTELGLEATSGSLGGPRSRHPLLLELLPDGLSSRAAQASASGVLDVLNVRYLASYAPLEDPELGDVSPPPAAFEVVQRRLAATRVAPFRLYERPHARPRASGVSAPTLVVGEPDVRRAWILERVRSADFDASREVLIESSAVEPSELGSEDLDGLGAVLFPRRSADDSALAAWRAAHGGTLEGGPAAAVRWLPDDAQRTQIEALGDERVTSSMSTCTVDVAGSATRFLLLAELFAIHPGWSARVDGVPAELERADGLATLLRLPPNSSRVTLSYRPPGLLLGAAITASTLLGLGCWAVWTWSRRRRSAETARTASVPRAAPLTGSARAAAPGAPTS